MNLATPPPQKKKKKLTFLLAKINDTCFKMVVDHGELQ